MTSFDGIATVQTVNTKDNQLIMFKGKFKCNSNYTVMIRDLNFHNVHLLTMAASWIDVPSFQVFIHRCKLRFDESSTGADSMYILIRWKIQSFVIEISNCSVNGSTNSGLLESNIAANNTSAVTMKIENSNIYNVKFAIKMRHMKKEARLEPCYINFIMNNNTFTSDLNSQHSHPLFVLWSGDKPPRLILKVTFLIINCKFRDRVITSVVNNPAILLIGGYIKIEVSESLFLRNTGRRGGVMALQTRAKFQNCIFEENKALTPLICGGDRLSGNGGAILLNGRYTRGSKLHFRNVTFKNNRASCFGDSIYAINFLSITVRNSIFFQAADDFHRGVSQGTMWYSQSKTLTAKDVKVILAGTAKRSRTIIFASAERHRHSEELNGFQCPLSSNIEFNTIIKNESIISYEKSPRSRKIQSKTLIVDCIVCPQTKYTIENSYAKVQKLDGKHIEIHFSKCQSCPFGAHCIHSVMPKRNFWGCVVDGKVQMISCPPGFCCQGENTCKRINSCDGKRTGILCGKCQIGYHLTFFANHCVKMDTCNVGQFWGLLVAVASIFVVLIAYLQKVFGVIVRIFNGKAILNMIKVLFSNESRKTGKDNAETAEERKVDEWEEYEVSHNGESSLEWRHLQEESQNCTHEAGDRTEETIFGDNEQSNEAEIRSVPKDEDANSTTGGVIKILFFYYQMNDLLLLYRSDIQYVVTDTLKKIFKSFFNLEPSSLSATDLGCPMINLSAAQKNLIKALFPLMMLFALTVKYILVSAIIEVSHKPNILRFVLAFKTSLQVASLQIILLGYSTLTSHILSLLTCVPMADDKQILFIDGNVSCYQTWQYVLLALVIIWSIPFVFSLYVASKSLADNSLSVRGFYTALIFPLPFALYALFKSKFCKTKTNQSDTIEQENVYHRINDAGSVSGISNPKTSLKDDVLRIKISDILGSPFRHIGKTSRRLPWEPMLILQRLLLLMLHAFLINPMTRSLSLLFAIFFITNLNIIIKPFHNAFLNVLNCLCLSFLFVSGVLNSFYAYIYVGGTALTGPFLAILSTLDVIELVMQLSFPCIAMLIIALVIMVRIVQIVYSIMKHAIKCCSKQDID
eukprot:Seg772.5 transcript_id=Seg772.5/GoldUCD/mRNA.D3Y31 product="hypothetical protein" protein_id=Seg772.5/GoldUCD/D3Y31